MKNRVKIERAIHELTQTELAEKVGVSRQTIYAIESQDYEPSVKLAMKIASVFEKRVDEIFELDSRDWD